MGKLFEKVELLDTVKHRNLSWYCLGPSCPSSCCYIPVRSNIALSEIPVLSKHFPIHFPVVKYQENQEPQFELNIFFKLEQDPKCCIYLKEPGGCALGKEKPIACKQYPFQVVRDSFGKNMIQLDFTCPGWTYSQENGAQLVFTENIQLNEYFRKDFVDPSLQFVNAHPETRAFIETLKINNLLIGGEYRYRGMAIPINFVSEERLLSLPNNILQEFRLKGYMQYIYLHLASLANFQKLIDAYLDRNPQEQAQPQDTAFVL